MIRKTMELSAETLTLDHLYLADETLFSDRNHSNRFDSGYLDTGYSFSYSLDDSVLIRPYRIYRRVLRHPHET